MRCRRSLCAALFVAAGFFTASNAAFAGTGESVAFQIDAAHSGSVELDNFKLPLKRIWKVDFGSWVSYPLVAGGKVFVTVSDEYITGTWGTTLYALDLKTGAIVWQHEIDETFSYWANLAYDNGTVFQVNFDSVIEAFDAETGKKKWRIQEEKFGQNNSPPVASGGRLFVAEAAENTLFAFDEKDGSTLWTQQVDGSTFSAPALGGNGVYLAYGCNAYGLSAKTGKIQWNYWYNCGGGSGETPVYTSKLVYARNAETSNLIFRAKDGSVKGVFAAGPMPAFFTDAAGQPMEAALAGGTLYGIHADTGIVAWTYSGDGALDSAPIVINGNVVEGSSQGHLYILDGDTGDQIWTDNLGSPIYPANELSTNEPFFGLGAGDDTLVVPASFTLQAFVSR